MTVLEGVLREEVARLERNVSSYEIMLSSLPRGTVFIRKMGDSYFAYRKRKENGKVVSEYLGNIKTEETQEKIQKSKEYKRIKNNLKFAKQELSKLKRAVRVYD